jgi:undecaprenyl-diphosphatase
VVGYLVSGLTAAVAVGVARVSIDHGLQGWDQRVLDAIAASWFSFPTGLWFEAWGSSAFLLPLLAVAVVLLAGWGQVLRAATLIVGYLLTKGLVLGAWQLWDRARPESIADGIAAPALHSYPSGHAVNALVVFGLLGCFAWRASRSAVERGLVVLVITSVVGLTCLGRVRLGAHWPSDILGGLVIGAVWLAGLVTAVVLAERTTAGHGLRLMHMASAAAWEQRSGRYRPAAFADEGFIHCCTDAQLAEVAGRYFRDRADLLLLTIDPDCVSAPIRWENLRGGAERFPHIYGLLDLEAVVDVRPMRVDGQGRVQIGSAPAG